MNNSIYPCLWFDNQSNAAATFYCSIFKNSKILSDNPMVTKFQLEGKSMLGLNGGPMFKINPSISLFVTCQTNEEIENIYNKLFFSDHFFSPDIFAEYFRDVRMPDKTYLR